MNPTAARPKGPLVLAIALGTVTSLGLVSYLQRLQVDRTSEELMPLVVAVRNVEPETKLQPGDLVVRQVPRRLYPADGVASPDTVAGRITKVALFPQDPLIAGKLYPPDSDGGMTFTIPPGKRAVTVAVNEVTGVAGFIKAGHRVDVIGVREDRGNDTAKAQIAVQNVPVLAVAQDREDKDGRTAKLVTSVTLMATPTEAELITLASEQGKIRLALRATGDNSLVKTAGARWQERAAAKPALGPVVRQAAAPTPPKAPATKPAAAPPIPFKPVIEVIRGSRRDVAGG